MSSCFRRHRSVRLVRAVWAEYRPEPKALAAWLHDEAARARARLPDEDERLTACAVAVGEGAGGRCRLVVKAGKQLGSRSTLSFSRYDLM